MQEDQRTLALQAFGLAPQPGPRLPRVDGAQLQAGRPQRRFKAQRPGEFEVQLALMSQSQAPPELFLQYSSLLI